MIKMEKLIKKIRSTKFRILLTVLSGALIGPAVALAIVSLNGQADQDQSFANDANITVNSANNTHTIGWNGVLPVSRGGTGTGSFTAGSILFSNGTVITEDNSNLFWNDTVNALSVGGNLSVGNNIIAGNLLGTNTGDQDLSGLVPYIGATGNVDLGTHGLITNVISLIGEQITTADAIFPHDVGVRSGSAQGNNNRGGSMSITSGRGDGTGIGGGIEVVAGNGGGMGNGGDANIRAGNGGAISGDGGWLSLFSGGGQAGDGGNIQLRAGSALSGNFRGGNVQIKAGANSGSGLVGTVTIQDPISNFDALLDTSAMLNSHIFTFPDQSGTFGLLEVNQTWGGLNKFETNANSTIYVGSAVKSGCIAMGDSDGSGVTYVTANDGVLSASTTKPSICQ